MDTLNFEMFVREFELSIHVQGSSATRRDGYCLPLLAVELVIRFCLIPLRGNIRVCCS